MWERELLVDAPGGRRIACLLRGPDGGHPVLHLHGAPGSRLEQRLFADDTLRRHGVRLLSLDRPGWGRTSPLRGDRPGRLADVLVVADKLGIDKFSVMGMSLGGDLAVVLAATAPDRVLRVALGAAHMPYDDASAIAGLQPAQQALLPLLRAGRTPELLGGLQAWRRQMLDDPIAGLAVNTATISEREREWFADPTIQQVLAADIREALAEGVEGMADDLLAWLDPLEVDPAAVRCPVRAIHGTEDDWEPLPNLTRFTDRMRDVQLLLMKGLNHFAPLLFADTLVGLAVRDR